MSISQHEQSVQFYNSKQRATETTAVVYDRQGPQIMARRKDEDRALAFFWFMVTAITLVLSLGIARLVS